MAALARVSLLLTLAAPLSAQAIPFSSLHAKVGDLKVFTGYKTIPDVLMRFYNPIVDSATTQYVYLELNMEYPAVAAGGDFVLQCTITGAGGVTASLPLNGHVTAGWSNSKHVASWGSETPGTWGVGDYQAACKDGQTVVATGKFTVSRDQFAFPDFHGVLTSLSFFESSMSTMTPFPERKAANTFANASTRVIDVQLGVDYPKATAASKFSVECTFTYPDQRKFNATLPGSIEVGWTGSWVSGGIGYEQPGGWALGTYNVECRYLGRAIAYGGFIIQ